MQRHQAIPISSSSNSTEKHILYPGELALNILGGRKFFEAQCAYQSKLYFLTLAASAVGYEFSLKALAAKHLNITGGYEPIETVFAAVTKLPRNMLSSEKKTILQTLLWFRSMVARGYLYLPEMRKPDIDELRDISRALMGGVRDLELLNSKLTEVPAASSGE